MIGVYMALIGFGVGLCGVFGYAILVSLGVPSLVVTFLGWMIPCGAIGLLGVWFERRELARRGVSVEDVRKNPKAFKLNSQFGTVWGIAFVGMMVGFPAGMFLRIFLF